MLSPCHKNKKNKKNKNKKKKNKKTRNKKKKEKEGHLRLRTEAAELRALTPAWK